jgi:hypothetical protein
VEDPAHAFVVAFALLVVIPAGDLLLSCFALPLSFAFGISAGL